MPLFELLPDIYVPAFEIKVGGSPLEEDVAKSILDVRFTGHLSPPDQFGFRVNDPQLVFIDPQEGLFTEGTRVEVSIGYLDNTTKMIVGEISALTADFPASGPATVQVDGFDLLHRLTRGTFYRTFEGSTPGSGLPDSQIVSQIASEMGLTPSLDTTSARTEPRVQNYITNLALLQEMARANGYFFWMEEDTLYFKSERPAPDTIPLEWGKTLLSFSPRLSTAGQVNTVEVRGWDPNQKQSFTARAQRSGSESTLSPAGQQQLSQGAGGDSMLVITDAPVSSAQEAQAHAEAVLGEQQQTLVTGSGSSVGKPEMRVGTILEISGVGRFDGSYVVEEVTHSIGSGGYQTSFQVRSKS